jgi:glycosyltransferase involved in cell wall biosynthesis
MFIKQILPMDVSIGIMAYNEEKNIGKLIRALLEQETKRIKIKEIVIVNSGSTDRTGQVVREFCGKGSPVKLISEPDRAGKSRAISRFLRTQDSGVLVMESADTIPEPGAIENLCLPLLDRRVGITVARPVSEYGRESLPGYVTNLIWDLYHHISMEKPKFGELIAFRGVLDSIEQTSVDEEFIGMMIKKAGLGDRYVPEAIYYNAGPRTMKGILMQRRRSYSGHLFLRSRRGHRASTMNALRILRHLKNVEGRRPLRISLAIMLEVMGRCLGFCDYLRKREDLVWKVVK